MFTTSKGFLAAAILFFLCSSGFGADYYKWVDESGNLHFSDSLQNVPEKYRDQSEKRVFTNGSAAPSGQTGEAFQGERRPEPESRKEKPLKRFEVPYKAYGGSAKRVIVAVTFNSSVTAPIAIDTGAPETIVSTRLAERIGLFNEDQGRLATTTGGIGGSAPAIRSIIDTVQVGGARMECIPVVVMHSLSNSFEGLLGLDFVSNYSVTIDSKRKIVVFEELPESPDHPGGHDKEWWTGHFSEFAESRDKWKAYSVVLEKRIHDSLQAVGNVDVKRKAFADQQCREAEKLLDKLSGYAIRNSVPIEWRQY